MDNLNEVESYTNEVSEYAGKLKTDDELREFFNILAQFYEDQYQLRGGDH